jgi:hypothetical protein
MSDEGIKDRVKEKYGQAALRVIASEATSCCGSARPERLRPGYVEPVRTGSDRPAA